MSAIPVYLSRYSLNERWFVIRLRDFAGELFEEFLQIANSGFRDDFEKHLQLLMIVLILICCCLALICHDFLLCFQGIKALFARTPLALRSAGVKKR